MAYRSAISDEQFTEVWQSSSSVEEVAQRLNLKVTTVGDRAGKLRAQGAFLKLLPPRPGAKISPLQGKPRNFKGKGKKAKKEDVRFIYNNQPDQNPVAAYAAAVFDGFGTLEARRAGSQIIVRVRVTTTKRCLVDFLQAHYRGELQTMEGNGHIGYMLLWKEGDETHRFLESIASYTQCYKEQIAVAVRWFEQLFYLKTQEEELLSTFEVH